MCMNTSPFCIYEKENFAQLVNGLFLSGSDFLSGLYKRLLTHTSMLARLICHNVNCLKLDRARTIPCGEQSLFLCHQYVHGSTHSMCAEVVSTMIGLLQSKLLDCALKSSLTELSLEVSEGLV